MASTYTIQNAADIVGAVHGSRGSENIHTPADLALAYMWNIYPWPQSLAELPPFWLVPDRQDYGAPISVVPSDFAGLWEAHIAHVPGDGSGLHSEPLAVVKNTSMLRYHGTSAWPANSIGYIPEISSFRLSAPAPENTGAPEWLVIGTYKKQPTKITGANIASTLIPWDDKYFGAYVEMLRWKWMQLQGDPRAGQVNVFSSGFRQYSGQAAVAHDAMRNALMDDEILGGSEALTPDHVFTEW